jgi:dihydrolipoamide dehydrogenase
MLAHAATREGLVAVNNMFGQKDRIRYTALPAVIYTHPEVAMVGRTEEELKNAGIKYKKSSVPMAVAGRYLVEHEDPTGFVKVLVGAEFGEILGVHAIGDASSEFIIAAASMVETEMSAAHADKLIFPHPTVSEALKEAIAGIH